MKTFLATLSLAALLSPAIAFADQPSGAAPPNAAQMQQHMAAFQQVHQKMEQLHTQARLDALASISSAHKNQIANLIGQLAISNKPDIDATARQIDALLSPSESQSVIRIHNTLRSQAQSIMEQAHSQMQHDLPPGAPQHNFKTMEQNQPTDAGHILLHLLVPAGHPMMMGMPHPM